MSNKQQCCLLYRHFTYRCCPSCCGVHRPSFVPACARKCFAFKCNKSVRFAPLLTRNNLLCYERPLFTWLRKLLRAVRTRQAALLHSLQVVGRNHCLRLDTRPREPKRARYPTRKTAEFVLNIPKSVLFGSPSRGKIRHKNLRPFCWGHFFHWSIIKSFHRALFHPFCSGHFSCLLSSKFAFHPPRCGRTLNNTYMITQHTAVCSPTLSGYILKQGTVGKSHEDITTEEH